MAPQTWFITGSSRGFGRALAQAALDAGDQVVATARTPAQLDDLAERYGDQVLVVVLDVTDAAAAASAFETAVGRFGNMDVVVNNAGYANVAPVETASEEDFRRQFETNFWGVYNVSKAALPVLKAQGAGTIVQFSSVGGRVGGTAGLGPYQAAKFAVDGLTRVLAAETAPLGIRYLVVEPGGFATDWAGASMEIQGVPDEYQATVGQFASLVSSGRMSRRPPEGRRDPRARHQARTVAQPPAAWGCRRTDGDRLLRPPDRRGDRMTGCLRLSRLPRCLPGRASSRRMTRC
jgi:NAD(P)-dependent dehydrogenase (short-subunit alcohol dehydrogenase family)